MARFARDCKNRMNEVTRQLELTLGPDTGDLKMRFGMHSGPVTAGKVPPLNCCHRNEYSCFEN